MLYLRANPPLFTPNTYTLDVSQFETEGIENKLDGKDPHDAVDKTQKVGAEERKGHQADTKNRLAGRRTYEEICRAYESMFAFDWDLRAINDLRHPPGKFSPFTYL